MNITETILANADVSTQEGLDQLQKDMNLAAANQLAQKILRIDYHSAQLRLVHSSALRDGEFDLARLQLIRSHLADMLNILEHTIPLAATLTPTVTIEPATAPEKEQP